MTDQEVIASILVNQRFMRNGFPPLPNVVDLLPKHLREEALEDARAIIDGLNRWARDRVKSGG